MLRMLSLAGLLLAALALSVPAQDVEPKRNTKLYKTPKDCFEAVLAASEKKDARAMVDCFTPEAVKQIAGDLAGQSFFMRDQAEGKQFKDKDVAKPDEETLKRLKPLLDVLDKHGLTAKATKDLRPKTTFRPTKKEREALLKLVKKPEQFVVDYMTAQAKAETTPRPKDAPKPKLADVKIDGDKATANVVVTFSSPAKDKDKDEKREIKQPIKFEKIDGGWRVNPQPDRKDEDDQATPKDKVKDGLKDKKEK
jgi:hypothetical protein